MERPIGVTLTRNDWGSSLEAAPLLEELGFAAIWVSGGQLDRLSWPAELERVTRTVPIGTAAISVDRFPAAAVAAGLSGTGGRLIAGLGGSKAHGELTADADADELDQAGMPSSAVAAGLRGTGGRLIAGLGGSKTHGELTAYFDELDRAGLPASARMLAALGPRRLQLAAERTAGAVTVLTTPAHTAWAREVLGPRPALVVQQCVVLDEDPGRDAARRMVEFHLDVPGYQAHFRRLGFGSPDDHLLDAVVVSGGLATIAERVHAHLTAGADQVALMVLKPDETDRAVPLPQLRRLAAALC